MTRHEQAARAIVAALNADTDLDLDAKLIPPKDGDPWGVASNATIIMGPHEGCLEVEIDGMWFMVPLATELPEGVYFDNMWTSRLGIYDL